MDFTGLSRKNLVTLAAVVAVSAGLGGCFDLSQKIAIGRDGSGGYSVSVAADRLVGDALHKKHADIDVGDMPMVTRVTRVGDTTVQTTGLAFHDLSQLRLSDESVSLHVTGKKWLGLGGTAMNFHRSFRVDHAREHHANDDDGLGRDVLVSMFGDHTYSFSVWLPGTIEHASPVDADGRWIEPQIADAGDGHTVTWRMKLTDMFLSDSLDFDVDFVSSGDFHDATSRPGLHRHHDDT